MERKIISLETVSEFVDTVLEVRRFEKNYFLYEKSADKDENIKYTFKAVDLLKNNKEIFETVVSKKKINEIEEKLIQYNNLVENFYSLFILNTKFSERSILENKIRTLGKSIMTEAETISEIEKTHHKRTLIKARLFIAASIVAVTLILIVIGQIISKMVVKPLKQLEESMKIISEGGFEKLHVNSNDGEILSLIDTFNKMLQEMELKQQHLIHSEKLASLGTLLSGVAHELNNPLSNISTSCQILSEEIEETDMDYKKQLIGQIDEQTVRARNIVRSLLDFSRNKEFSKESISLKKLTEEVLVFIRGRLLNKMSIIIDIAEDLMIIADKQKLQQIFLNLISNAADVINGQGQISISAKSNAMKSGVTLPFIGLDDGHCIKTNRKCIHESESVDIEISDTGEGIPDEVLHRIFDPFFTTKDVGKGAGLGLYIVHEIVEDHGGCLSVKSTVGEGTTFKIRLPLKGNLIKTQGC
ncbi:MAG: HAMP domain-containing histidine kinase [Nitrospirae bacterium YQR-1]